jgi:DNA-binding response OmpR family regulator
MQTGGTRVLVIHRHRELATRIRKEFEGFEGVDVEFLEDNREVRLRGAAPKPDVIVLDLSAVAPHGYEVYRILHSRSAAPPVVILRAPADESRSPRTRWQVNEGIEAVEARLHMALGRSAHKFWLPLKFAGIHLIADLPNTHVTVDGRAVAISTREGELLGVLLAQCNRLVRREVLISEIWGYETRSLDVHIRRLRRKLGAAGAQLETVTAFGYRFVEHGSQPDAASKNKMEFTHTKQKSRDSVTPSG